MELCVYNNESKLFTAVIETLIFNQQIVIHNHYSGFHSTCTVFEACMEIKFGNTLMAITRVSLSVIFMYIFAVCACITCMARLEV